MIHVLIGRLLYAYQTLIVVEVVLSWLRMTQIPLVEDFYQALATIVEPYLGLFRRFLPPVGGVDFSPILALVVLQLAQRII
ncbi:hypothetical protein HMPREF1008_01627 [Olsenella sp. oral taxon 809 str. F0356]|uniref:YggT family protein n=1 Tax=Olsenella sp. oral taxon 809 TaxID=661086 RepID=UPI000231F363|nr:YggT family protein [Olsenella sp. oral taxon 809]EHF01482.1 hypothetical protein HMPREF1008_01627 [Olsenella sp. oral taxon 809 str. F0356]